MSYFEIGVLALLACIAIVLAVCAGHLNDIRLALAAIRDRIK